jgi:CheY-like chemotaxis protein/two-component sensor histidine kinase
MKKRLPDDAQLNRLLDNAILGAKRGASLTQRMLAFARRQELNVVPIDLPKLVGGMSELLQRSLDGTTDLDIQVPPSLKPVVADANQLELALLNLTVNARDAMPAGGRIQITAREAAVAANDATGLAPGAYVCLSVRDNGEGMDADTLARATEPFFTTKGVGKGTGLGLSMVHGMTEQIGGRLILTSERGKGTEAQIWLPVADDLSRPETAPAADTESTASKGLKILAVDDDALVLFNTTAMLEDMGHTVIEARSGEDALGILAREKIDVLITDQAMPKMTGVQLLEAVKSRWPRLPAILATGYAEIPGGQAVDVVRLGKPFAQVDLAKAIAQLWLDKGH